MNPHVVTSVRLVKGGLRHSKTVLAVGASVPESHPRRCSVTARDLVPAVDELSTREALELELTLTARMTFHSPLSSSSCLESKVTGGSLSCVHVKFRLEVSFPRLFVLNTTKNQLVSIF